MSVFVCDMYEKIYFLQKILKFKFRAEIDAD